MFWLGRILSNFFEKMSRRFELVIFTASISNYANTLLNAIDKMICLLDICLLDYSGSIAL